MPDIQPDDTLHRIAVITAIHTEGEDVKTFTVANEDGSDIPYVPGQFITFAFMQHGREERRSFSVSSGGDGPLRFTIKRVENGAYSRYLSDRARVGDRLLTTGASGLFMLPADVGSCRQLFFFAAGIGITPVYSLIQHALRTLPAMHIALVYSNHSPGSVVFYEELQALARQYASRLKIEYLYSTAYDLNRARLNKLLLPTLLAEYSTAPKEQQLFYVCGPYTYMRMAIFTLQEHGIRDAQIKRENFNTNDRQVASVPPPDTGTHTVVVAIHSARHSIQVRYPDTILQAARRQGIALPYSCETGRCGSCMAVCTYGKVWLSYNEVLTEADLAQGRVLTCTGHPVGGDAELAF